MQYKMYNSFMVITLLTFVGQFFSLLRVANLAEKFGTSTQMDSFNLANNFTVYVIAIIGGSVSTVLLPYLAHMNDSPMHKRVLNSYLNTILGASLILMICYLLFSSAVIILNPDNNSILFSKVAVSLSLSLGIGQYIRLLSSIKGAYMQIDGQFISIKFAAVISTALSYIYIALNQNITIETVAISISISYFFEFLYLVLRNNNPKYRFSFILDTKDSEYKKLIKLTVPIIFSSLIYQVSLLIPNLMAIYFGEGYVSRMVYANQIGNIIQILVVGNVITIVYPQFAKLFQMDIEKGKYFFVRCVNISNIIVIPLVFGMIVVGDLVIQILFERGNFTRQDTLVVWKFLIWNSLTIPLILIREFLFRIYYSIGDTKNPVKNSIVVIILQIFFLGILAPFVGIYSMMLAPFLSTMTSVILSYKKLIKQIGTIDIERQMIRQLGLVILNSLTMMVVVYAIKTIIHFNILVNLGLLIFTGIISYGIGVILFQRKYIFNK